MPRTVRLNLKALPSQQARTLAEGSQETTFLFTARLVGCMFVVLTISIDQQTATRPSQNMTLAAKAFNLATSHLSNLVPSPPTPSSGPPCSPHLPPPRSPARPRAFHCPPATSAAYLKLLASWAQALAISATRSSKSSPHGGELRGTMGGKGRGLRGGGGGGPAQARFLFCVFCRYGERMEQ